jgi:hypothetical protein
LLLEIDLRDFLLEYCQRICLYEVIDLDEIRPLAEIAFEDLAEVPDSLVVVCLHDHFQLPK